jgi:hypothetical protein
MKYGLTIVIKRGSIIVQSEALDRYPKCDLPIYPKSIVFPESRPPFKEWWIRISKN